jgi:iron complex outermembrane recepter protein
MTAEYCKSCWRYFMMAILAPGCWAQQSNSYDLSQASIEDLMNIPVTSVSKKEQKLSKTGAAVFVISQEDIRRSGATNIPDLLRMAPGVDVAQVDANRWAISIRGFTDQHADKVLVLIDGRSVYSQSFSGVFWDMVDVPLEDIERIEIIRGPGGTIWGANAVNGVINIITKAAAATPGALISTGGGTEDRAEGLAQYGGQIGQTGSYRIFGKYFDVGNAVFPDGQQAADGWQAGHAGFRTDWDLTPQDNLMVQGDFARTQESQTITTVLATELPLVETFNDPLLTSQGDALARWNHNLANGGQISLQVYDSYTHHLDLGFLDSENTLGIDFEHHLALGSRNDVVWGLGARVVNSEYGQGYDFTLLPHHRIDPLYSAFVQDELKLSRTVSLTAGTKWEHNDITGCEFQPSAQVVWTPGAKQTLWISAARALREPSSVDVGLYNQLAVVPAGPTFGVVLGLGNPNIKSEELRDFEAGYRAMLSKRTSFDIAVFDSYYRNLESVDAEAPYLASQNGVPYLVLPYLFVNGGRVHTYGGEIFGNWNVTEHWRISPGYSFFHMGSPEGASSLNPPPGVAPDQQFQIRSLMDLPRRIQWDTTLEYVGMLAEGNIPAYARLDSRLGWRSGESVEWSIVGQNLLSPRHAEFADLYYPLNHTLVERAVFGKVTFRF